MCGRAYKTYTKEELYFQYLNKRPLNLIDFTPVYNFCPTQNTLVLRRVEGELQLEEMRWQLVPNFEPTFTTTFSTINAKSETVFESRLFGDLVVRHRCVVPFSGMPHSAYHSLCRPPDYAERSWSARISGLIQRFPI